VRRKTPAPDPRELRERPTLTTSDVGKRLHISGDFVRAEILDGRLHAFVLRRPGLKRLFRVSEAQYENYLQRHWRPA